MSDDPRLYHELAYLWPIISAPEEYLREAICWHEVLQHKLRPGKHHILELRVGAGLNLFHDCLPLAITDFLTVKAQHLNQSFQPCVGAREVDAYTPLTHDFQID